MKFLHICRIGRVTLPTWKMAPTFILEVVRMRGYLDFRYALRAESASPVIVSNALISSSS